MDFRQLNAHIRTIVISDVSCLIPLNSSGIGTTLMSFIEKIEFLKAISEHFLLCLICIKTSVQGSEISGPVVTGFRVGGLLTGYLLAQPVTMLDDVLTCIKNKF